MVENGSCTVTRPLRCVCDGARCRIIPGANRPIVSVNPLSIYLGATNCWVIDAAPVDWVLLMVVLIAGVGVDVLPLYTVLVNCRNPPRDALADVPPTLYIP